MWNFLLPALPPCEEEALRSAFKYRMLELGSPCSDTPRLVSKIGLRSLMESATLRRLSLVLLARP